MLGQKTELPTVAVVERETGKRIEIPLGPPPPYPLERYDPATAQWVPYTWPVQHNPATPDPSE